MKKLFVMSFLFLVLVSCGGGGTATISSNNGTLIVVITDAPTEDFSHIYVTISGVRIHSSAEAGAEDAGWHDLTLEEPVNVDLLSLDGGAQTLGQLPLEAGLYQQIRLVLVPNSQASPLNDSVVPAAGPNEGLELPLDIASEDADGIRIVHQFTVNQSTEAELVLDFDGAKSVIANGGGTYSLQPVINASVVDPVRE